MKQEIFALGIYEHRLWGFILLPFALTKSSGKEYFTCSYIMLPDESDANFLNLTDAEKRIVTLSAEYGEKRLFKLFSRDKNLKVFLEKVAAEKIENFIRPYIEKRIASIIDIIRLTGTSIFLRNRSGARIYKEDFIRFVESPVQPLFTITRKADETKYTLELLYKGSAISLMNQKVDILCENPALIRINQRMFFVNEIEAKKIKPFLSKDHISISLKNEIQYFTGFVKNVIRDFEVKAEGFQIHEIKAEKKALISLEMDMDSKFVLVLRFLYCSNKILANSDTKIFVDFNNYNGEYSFNKYYRDYDFEQKYQNFLESRSLISFDGTNFLYNNQKDVSKESQEFILIEWINRYSAEIIEAGLIFEQNLGDKRFHTGPVEITFNPVLVNDWFDIYAQVKVGEYEIPFLKFKKHILSGDRQFKLPDGETFIIPEEWFSRYKEVMEFAKSERNHLKLHKQHFVFVEKATGKNNNKIFGNLEKLKLRDELSAAELPVKLNATLRPYQIEGYTWLLYLQQNNLGGCLADDLGLGKTVQTISVLLKNKEKQKVNKIFDTKSQSQGTQLSLFKEENQSLTSIIVVPASLVHNWANEIRKFAPLLKVYPFFGIQRRRDLLSFKKYDVIISSYHTVRQDINFLADFRFHYAILDESQVIKNPDSKVYKSVVMLSAEHRLILTGTPIENSLIDLWAQMNFVNHGLLGSLNFFRNEYVYPIERKGDVTAELRLKELIRPFILRRAKAEVAKDLPEITDQVIYCSMTEEQRKFYEAEKSRIRNSVFQNIESEGLEKSSFIVLQGLTQLRQIANHPVLIDPEYGFESGKFNEIIRNTGNVTSEGHKVLFFSSFVKHLELFRKEMVKERIKYEMLTGASVKREDIIKAFQEHKVCKVFLISLKAGGIGLNLTSADYVFILDPWWNPASEQQAISRSHRIGQKRNVFVYRYISENSIEEKIHNLQEKKTKLAETFITSNNPLKHISRKDLEVLFD